MCWLGHTSCTSKGSLLDCERVWTSAGAAGDRKVEAGLTWTEKASRAVGVVVRAACPAAAYGFDVELVSVLATRVPTVACTGAALSQAQI